MGHREPAGRDETPRRERRETELVRPPLGLETPAHHGEGALGLGVRGRFGQGQMDPEPVVPARIHEPGDHPDDPFVGPQLDGGRDLDGPLPGPGPGDAVDVLRPR